MEFFREYIAKPFEDWRFDTLKSDVAAALIAERTPVVMLLKRINFYLPPQIALKIVNHMTILKKFSSAR